MTADKYILDNRDHSVVDYLKQRFVNARLLRIVSAYFSIYGYQLLQEELQQIKEARFLFGDPASVGEVDPGEKEQKSFNLNENGLIPNHQLQQKHLARQCSNWVAESGVGIRSVSRSNFLHGKMYLTNTDDTTGNNSSAYEM